MTRELHLNGTMIEYLVFSLLVVVGVSSATSQCPTWFKETDNGSCECGPALGDVIKCDKSSEQVSIGLGYCMTHDDSSGELSIGYTNYDYMGGQGRAYIALPSNITKLNDICAKNARKGFLCGECTGGFGVPINSLHMKCVECSEFYAIGMYLLLVILPITIFFVLVVMFRLNFTSGPFLGYIIFCQLMISFVRKRQSLYQSVLEEMDVFGQTMVNILLSLSGIWWYSVSVFWWIPPVCLSKRMNYLQMVSLDYVFVLYPLFLLTLTYVCIELHARNFRPVIYLWKPFHKCFVKVRRNWSASDSIIHAYATFFFLSFSSLATVSFDLLWATDVYSMNGTITRRVVVLDPTVERYSPQHLQYAVPAITLLLFLGFCPTLFLCLFSTRIFARCFRFGPRTQLFLCTFTDAFQNCYKDGLNGTYDFRFFSSFPMFLHILVVLIAGFVEAPQRDFWIVCGIIFFTFSCGIAYVKPYKSAYMNFSLSFHFIVIGVIADMLCLWFKESAFSSHSLATILTFLISLPHLCAFFTLMWCILKRIRLTKTVIQFAIERILTAFHCTHEDLTSSLPDRLENSHAYQSLPDI